MFLDFPKGHMIVARRPVILRVTTWHDTRNVLVVTAEPIKLCYV